MRTVLLCLGIAFMAAFCNTSKNDRKQKEENKDVKTVASTTQDREIIDTIPSLTDTTYTIGSYKLAFKKVDSIFIPELYENSQERKAFIAKFDSTQEGRGFEAWLLASGNKQFKRTGKKLTFFLQNGKTLTLTDGGEEEAYYTFESFFPKINYGLVDLITYGEDLSYCLVNFANGKLKMVIGQPWISPSAKQIMTINDDMVAGFSSNGFQMLTKQADSLVTNFTVETGNWAPLAVKWLSENAVVFKIKQQKPNEENPEDYSTSFYKLTISQ
jgi:hypothetical protein